MYVCVWRYINIYIKRFQTKTNGQCVRVYVCQSFGVLMNFSALVRFLFVSFECRFVSSFYRYQRARNDAIPWAEDSSSSRREGKWRKERLVNFAINREQNLISACVGSLCGCVCARIINWLLIFIWALLMLIINGTKPGGQFVCVCVCVCLCLVLLCYLAINNT